MEIKKNIKKIFFRCLFFIIFPLFASLNPIISKAFSYLNLRPQVKNEYVEKNEKIKNYEDLISKIKNGEDFFIKIKQGNNVKKISFDEYVIGATAAEIGLNAPIEAIKAQMVACATFAISVKGVNGEYVVGDIFQCYMPKEKRIEIFGEEKEKIMQELAKKNFTKTLLLYDNKIAQTVFATCFPGFSRANHEAWHNNYAKMQQEHLQPVYSPELDFFDEICKMNENKRNIFFKKYNKDEVETIKKYLNSVRKTFKIKTNEAFQKIKNNNPKATMPINKNETIKIISKFNSGYVKEVEAFGVKLSGGQFRKILGLTSTYFDVSIQEDEIIINCVGNGHGVGMSQIGAIVYALKGLKWDQILKHYYSTKNNSKKIKFVLLKNLDSSFLIK